MTEQRWIDAPSPRGTNLAGLKIPASFLVPGSSGARGAHDAAPDWRSSWPQSAGGFDEVDPNAIKVFQMALARIQDRDLRSRLETLFGQCFADSAREHFHGAEGEDDENEYESSAGLRPPMRRVPGEGVEHAHWPAIEKWLREKLSDADANDAMEILRASGADLPRNAVEAGPGGRFAEPLDHGVTLIKRSEQSPARGHAMDVALDAMLRPKRSKLEAEAERLSPGLLRIAVG